MTNKKVNCLNCGHEQTISDSNIWQDIKGKFTVCEKCESSYDVEPTENLNDGRKIIREALSNYKECRTKDNGIKLVRAVRHDIEVIAGITIEDLYMDKVAFSKLVRLAQKV